jgi:hypothetical protein
MVVRLTLAAVLACAMPGGCGGKPPADTTPSVDMGAATGAAEAPAASPGTATLASADQPPAEPAPGAIPPPPANPLAVGSQKAKDEMYCSAVIYAANPDVPNALAPIDEALLRKAQMMGFVIGEAGINQLVSEKAIHATHASMVADAYAAQVEKDSAKGGKLRISLEECNKRAGALPVPQ